MRTKAYRRRFYEKQSYASYEAAREVVPLVLQLVPAERVVDIGCGTGAWLAAFRQAGVKTVLGIDGPWVDKNSLLVPEGQFLAHDLCEPLPINEEFDLVVCLEVAEHIPREHAESFVDSLVALGPVVLFSAAIPFQVGTHHVNGQWPSYWAEKFNRRGYTTVDCVRRKIWRNDKVAYWYAQNTILFVKQECLDHQPSLRRERGRNSPEQLDLVHPAMLVAHADPRRMNWRKAIRDLPTVVLSSAKRFLRRLFCSSRPRAAARRAVCSANEVQAQHGSPSRPSGGADMARKADPEHSGEH